MRHIVAPRSRGNRIHRSHRPLSNHECRSQYRVPFSIMSSILAGDIGGTKTRLAVIKVSGTQVLIEREAGYPSRGYATFEALLGDFLSGIAPPGHAAFGIAGPVKGRVVHTTNLPWRIDADALQQQFGFAHCTLVNDLEATAHGLPALGAEDLLTLHAGAADASGNAAVIAAGTGLGEAGLFWDGQRHHPYATEGGHASFSPQSEFETDLLRYLQQRYLHVSWERVVSGMGLLDLHEFLRSYRKAAAPRWLAATIFVSRRWTALCTSMVRKRAILR